VDAEQSLSTYIQLAWPIIEPDTPFLPNWHIDAITEYLTACTTGQIKRLIVNIPPKHVADLGVGTAWPGYALAVQLLQCRAALDRPYCHPLSGACLPAVPSSKKKGR
jgi:hypothetical protein